MTSITLHPTAGVNPTIAVCFWCGEDTGELALMGRNKGVVAPMRTILNYDPCGKCREAMSTGITIMEVMPAHQAKTPEFHNTGVAPTGKWIVMKEDAIERLPLDHKAQDSLRQSRKGFMEQALFDHLFAGVTNDG